MAVISARTLTPIAGFAATWLARKGLAVAYTKRTGHPPPVPDDPEVPLRSVLIWAISTAVVAAAVDVVVTRVLIHYTSEPGEGNLAELPEAPATVG